MPANANIKQAIEAALQAANEVFQSMGGSEAIFDNTMTAAIASKHMGGTYDPCVYGRVINDEGDRVVTNVYVDDVRMYWDTSDAACAAATEDQKKVYDRH